MCLQYFFADVDGANRPAARLMTSLEPCEAVSDPAHLPPITPSLFLDSIHCRCVCECVCVCEMKNSMKRNIP